MFRNFWVGVLGVLLWLLYGLMISQWPAIVSNIVALALVTTILVTKIVAEHRPRAGSETVANTRGE